MYPLCTPEYIQTYTHRFLLTYLKIQKIEYLKNNMTFL